MSTERQIRWWIYSIIGAFCWDGTSVVLAGVECYTCNTQTDMKVQTDDCWKKLSATSSGCLLCYTEVVDWMRNDTVRGDRELKRNCISDMAGVEPDKKLYAKLTADGQLAACPIQLEHGLGRKGPTGDNHYVRSQTHRCYCTAPKCNIYEPSERKEGEVITATVAPWTPPTPSTPSTTSTTANSTKVNGTTTGGLGIHQGQSTLVRWLFILLGMAQLARGLLSLS